jgi:3-hydroxyisobutyryl-CoA hydrolase
VSYEEVIQRFFNPQSPFIAAAPNFQLDAADQAREPMKYGLPTEEEIMQVVKGTHPSSASTGMDFAQVVEQFKDLYTGKAGVSDKVSEVLTRKCKVVEDPDNFHHLSWVS